MTPLSTLVTSPALDAALAYVEAGFNVVAIAPGTGTPFAGCDGVADATGSPAAIRQLWAEHPDASVGTACGASGVVAVHVDVKGGGPVSLSELESRSGKLPETVTASTPGGGLHFLYKMPPERFGSPVGCLPGVDVRGDGGYVVAAPSALEAGSYRWREGCSPLEREPAEMPGWLRDSLQKPKASAVLDNGAPIAEGARNATLTALPGIGARGAGTRKRSIRL